MYTLQQLQQKNLAELKEIGWQLNVLPASDRRCRQNWIDALVGVNPPLLQLLEASPAADAVEQVQPIRETVETPSAVEVEPVQTLPIESKFGRIVYPRPAQDSIAQAAKNTPGAKVAAQCQKAIELLQQKNLAELEEIAWCVNRTGVQLLPEGDSQCRQSLIDALVANLLAKNIHPLALQYLCRRYVIVQEASSAEVQRQEPIAQAAKTSPGVEELDRRQEPIAQAAENSPGVDVDRVQEPIVETVETSPAVSVEQVHPAIAPAAKISPGADVDRVSEPKSIAHELLQLFKSSVRIEEPITETVKNFPRVEVDTAQEPIDVQRHEAIELQAQDSIEQAAENSLDVEFSGFERVTQSNRKNFSGFERVTQFNRNNFSGFERFQEPEESDRHLILTGLTFSDRFLARYAPPQAQIIHFQSDADGQLSLLDFEIESVDEPPDPDDFESLDAFREALVRWDCEHNEVSPEHNESLQVSLESFCLWGLCPADWYELAALLEPSSMLELPPTRKSSITSDFFIPTFDRLSDRFNKSDEPPDTVVFAKLPKPKPPRFPPATVGQVRAKLHPNSAQTQSKRNLNAYQTHTCCILAGSSMQPARSPPSGDAGF